MTDIAEFIAARLAEDEFAAHTAMRHPAEGPAETWDTERRGTHEPDAVVEPLVRGKPQLRETGEVATSPRFGVARHIARHDPARALRQVDRDRRVLDRHRPEDIPGTIRIGVGGGDICAGCGVRNGPAAWPCAEVRDLAAVYAEHPDYRPDWKF